MFGLCGWYGEAGEAAPWSDVLDTMARRSAPQPPDYDHRRATEGAALVAMGGEGGADLRCHGQIWAAIEGSFRWSGPRLAALSASRGPAAALIEAYQGQGRGCLELLSGRYSLCVFDDRDHAVLLAADGFGSRPIVFGQAGPRLLVFGSSTACVRMHPAIRAEIDPDAVAAALALAPGRTPDTMFFGLDRLRPGQALTFKPGAGVKIFEPDARPQSGQKTSRLPIGFRDRLGDAVSRSAKWAGTGRVGVLLDGGLEAAAIAAALRNEWIDKAASFRAGFDPVPTAWPKAGRAGSRSADIARIERMISDHDIVSSIDRLAGAFDEPQRGLAMVPSYLGAGLARERGITVLQSGYGGARLLGGHRNATPPPGTAAALRRLAFGAAPRDHEPQIDLSALTRAIEFAGVRAEFPFLEETMTALPALDAGGGLLARRRTHRRLQRMMHDRLPEAAAAHGEADPWRRLGPMFRDNTGLRTLLCDSLARLVDHRLGETAGIAALRDQAAGPGLADADASLAWRLLMFERWHHVHTVLVRRPDYRPARYEIAQAISA